VVSSGGADEATGATVDSVTLGDSTRTEVSVGVDVSVGTAAEAIWGTNIMMASAGIAQCDLFMD
jgi:hypothetical protein